MNHSEYIDILPLMSARGTVVLPGSKSISNRVLLLAALSHGTTEVRDLLRSDDTDRMLEGLQTLGIKIESLGGNDYKVAGCGGEFPVKQAELFLGNAGTAFRPLTAALALSGGNYILSGVARMHERPIGDLVEALRALGANIDYLGVDGFPPLQINSPSPQPSDEATDKTTQFWLRAKAQAIIDSHSTKPASGQDAGYPLKGEGIISVRGDVSSQFLTALLMALPLLQRAVTVEVIGELISKPYIEITLAMMARFGVAVQRDGWCSFTVAAGSRYASPGVIYVEGDASSASYFLAAGAIGGGPVRVEGVGKSSIQGDVRFAEELEKMGAVITTGENWIEASAPVDGRLKAIDLDCNHIPDAAMTLAVAALYAEGTTTLRNIASWRVKETDRIAAMATELRKVGALVEEGADYIKVTGCRMQDAGCSQTSAPSLNHESCILHPESRILNPESLILNPASGIDTYDDHRMAMCFSLAAFGAGIRINDPKCVGKTFPDYFAAFASVTQAVPVIAIDGPSASGKGTVAQRVAMQLGFHYLDSGALYRLLAMAAERDGVGLDDEAALAELAARIDIRFEGEQIWLDGVLAGVALRGEQCAAAASRVAALPLVRLALLNKQRAFRRAPGLVTDGRDMASVVFPDALHKIFLTASAEARAERRYKQLKEKGMDASMPDLLQDIRTRDERDTNRSAAPLQQSPDASLLDTTALNIEQAVESVLTGYRMKCLAP